MGNLSILLAVDHRLTGILQIQSPLTLGKRPGRFRWTLVGLIGMMIFSSVALAADWGRFRGPEGDGRASGNLPLTWSEQENVVWKVPVPGSGHSSPVIGDGKIWMTTAITKPLSKEAQQAKLADLSDAQSLNLVGELSLRAVAFDQHNGDLLHDIELFKPESPEPIHVTNTYASPTPVLHDGRLHVHFGTYGTAALDAASGKVLWRFNDLHIDHQNGPGSSPIVWEDLLIIHFDGTDQQCLIALGTIDGKLVWRKDRSGEMHSTPQLRKAYCTPVVVQTDQGPELISPAANWVYGYRPRDGSELWKASYGDLGFSTVPCPVIGNGMAYVCTSFMQSKLLAVRYGGRGDVTQSHLQWTASSNIPQKPSLALVDQRLFACSDSGILTCMDASDGKELWRARIRGKYSASPLICEDRVYFFSQEGKTTVISAADEYQELAVNQLDGSFNASAAAADGALYLRTDSHLYRIEQR